MLVAWVLLQVASIVFPILEVPEWGLKLILALLLIGFPVSLVLAWAYETSPQGLVRTKNKKTGSQDDTKPPNNPAWNNVLIGVLCLVIVGQFVYNRYWSKSPSNGASGEIFIAVLPFDNLNKDKEQEFYTMGLSEGILSEISGIPGVKVAARSSSFSFQDQDLDVREIERRLGVSHVIDGSIRKSEDELFIHVQLVDASQGHSLWNKTYVRKPSDVFDIQEDITSEVARIFNKGQFPKMANQRKKNVNLDAYNLYLKGRHAWNLRTESSLKNAVDFFNGSIEKDDTFAEAYTGLADAYAVLGFYDFLPPSEAFQKSRAAAKRAIALDGSLAQPYATLGYIGLYYDWNWNDAENNFTESIERDYNYAVAHQWYANFLVAMGRFKEAEEEASIALKLDPLSMIINTVQGWVHYYSGQYDKALLRFDEALMIDPNYYLARLFKGQTLVVSGRYDQAKTEFEKTIELTGESPLNLINLGMVYAMNGDHENARNILKSMEAGKYGEYVPSFEMAKLSLMMNYNEKALDYLKKGYDQRSHSMAFLNVDPLLQKLRSEPAFIELLQKVGF